VSALSRHRRSIAVLFFVNGTLFGTWASRIPAVKESLGLSEAQLGLALLGLGLGTIVVLPLASAGMARRGSGAVTAASAIACCALLPLAGLAPSLGLLTAALAAFGAALGGMDVSMNAQAVLVEREAGRSLMAAFHGLWSLGALCGASLGGVVAERAAHPALHFGGVAAALALAVLLGAAGRLVHEGREPAEAPFLAWPPRAALGIGLIGGCASLVEGGIADWSGVYLRDRLGVGPGFAAAGYAAFSLAMVAGRFSGDRLIDRFGRVPLLRAGSSATGLALGTALLCADPYAAVGAFVIAGLGMSTVFPIAFGVAGRLPGPHPGHTIAAVATMAYGGALVGPPFIGFAARATSLPAALGLLVLGCGVIAVLAGRAARDR
jgi:MFS family permease